MAKDRYEVFAIRYGSAQRSAPENFIGGDPHTGPMPMDYFLWVARSEERTVVVDTGFSLSEGGRRGRRVMLPPARGLGLLGIDAGQVKDVILTHLHYDHAGNCGLFPNARFHVQEQELNYATGPRMRYAFLRHAYDVESVVSVVRLLYDERVRCCDDGDEIAPGLTVHRIGGHTAGLQVVRVETGQGPLLLASDASHYYANEEQFRPFPIVLNVGEMLEGYDRMRGLVSDPQRIVPGHDPQVMRRFPAASPEAVDHIVALHTGYSAAYQQEAAGCDE